jgi:radical SAM superfamily enzyme YgiQ (UPF0313 family)
LHRGPDMCAFDLAGRPVSWTRHGVIHRRGLDGTVLELVRKPGREAWEQGVRRLAPEELAACLGHVRSFLKEGWRLLGKPEPLRRAVELDPNQDAARFRSIWSPVMILPPDQYRSLVLQLTEGCSYNLCSFCTFYKKRPYRVLSQEEFTRHVEEALAFMGAGLAWRRGVFLADANAASLPDSHLLAALSWLHRRLEAPRPTDSFFQPEHLAGFSSFLDTFSTLRRSLQCWRELAELGLNSLHLGIETGSDRVLRVLRKPGSAAQAEELVGLLKAAGIRVGVIVMTGVGGTALAEEHVEKTADLLNRLPLETGDRISLSEFEPDPGSPYVLEEMADLLDRQACREQSRELRSRLRFPAHPQGPVVSHYDVRQFVY